VLTQSDLLIALDDLTDVTLTAPATGAVLFKSAGNWLDTPGILIDPAADVKLHQATVEVARTLTAAAGGFEANNTLTGAGFERVLTVADLFTGGLNDLNDVTLTAPATGSVLYKSAGDWLDTNAIQIDPAARILLLDNGNLRFRTDINEGIAVFATTDLRPKVVFRNIADDTDLGLVGFPNSNGLTLRNNQIGGFISLTFTDVGPATHSAFQATPGADARLYFDNASVARTAAAASGGLEANNTLTGAGFERVLTTADIFGGALNDLSDVVITAAASFDTFFFNGSNWVDSAMLQITGDGATQGGATINISGIGLRGRFTNAGESGGSTQTILNWLDDDASVSFGEIEFRSTGGGTDGDTMYYRNRRHGGTIEFEGENDIGTLVPMLGFDPQTVINTLHTDIVIDGGTTRLIEIFPTGGARFQIEQVAGGADPTTLGYTGGQPQLTMTDSAIVTLGNIGTGSGQTIIGGGLNDRVDIFADTTNNFRLQWTGADWAVESRVNGAELILRARDGGGTMIDMLVMDASGNSRLRQGTNNLDVLITRVGGFRTIGNTANTPATGGTQVNFFDWENNAGDIAATMGFNTSIDWRFYNQVHAGSILFDGENTAGTLRNLVAMDPDDDIKLFDAGTEVFRTLPVASGGAEADNQLTGVGFRRVLTEGDQLTDEITGDIAVPGVAFVTVLSIRGEINRTYSLTGFLMTLALSAADDETWRIRGPAGMTAFMQVNGIFTGPASFRVTELQALLADSPGGGVISSGFISGSVIMGGTAGSVTIEVAKQADAGGDLTANADSWMQMVPVPAAP
jgi:hypothetical protein